MSIPRLADLRAEQRQAALGVLLSQDFSFVEDDDGELVARISVQRPAGAIQSNSEASTQPLKDSQTSETPIPFPFPSLLPFIHQSSAAPRLRSFRWVLNHVDAILDARWFFWKEDEAKRAGKRLQLTKAQEIISFLNFLSSEDGSRASGVLLQGLASFVNDHFQRTLGLHSLSQKALMEFAWNLAFAIKKATGSELAYLQLFANLLNDDTAPEELIFFCYVRVVLLHMLKKWFSRKGKSSFDKLALNVDQQQIRAIVKHVFKRRRDVISNFEHISTASGIVLLELCTTTFKEVRHLPVPERPRPTPNRLRTPRKGRSHSPGQRTSTISSHTSRTPQFRQSLPEPTLQETPSTPEPQQTRISAAPKPHRVKKEVTQIDPKPFRSKLQTALDDAQVEYLTILIQRFHTLPEDLIRAVSEAMAVFISSLIDDLVDDLISQSSTLSPYEKGLVLHLSQLNVDCQESDLVSIARCIVAAPRIREKAEPRFAVLIALSLRDG